MPYSRSRPRSPLMFRNALALFLAAAALATGVDWVHREHQFAQLHELELLREGSAAQPTEGPGSHTALDRYFELRSIEGRYQAFKFELTRQAERAHWVPLPHWLILALAVPYPILRILRAGRRDGVGGYVSSHLRRSPVGAAFRWTLTGVLATCALLSVATWASIRVGRTPDIDSYSSLVPEVLAAWEEEAAIVCVHPAFFDFQPPPPYSFSARVADVRIAIPIGTVMFKDNPPWPNPQIARWGAAYSWARTESGGRLHVFTIPYWLIALITACYPVRLVVADPLRRRRRRRRGLCPMCGYDLRGSPSGVCSECGYGGASRATRV